MFLLLLRFLFVLLGPKGKAKSYHEIGRAIATLMSDEVLSYSVICQFTLTISLQTVQIGLALT